MVKDWLKKSKERIEVFFLPSYSPELNADEYLNCDLKAGVHSKAPAKRRDQLSKNAVCILRKLQTTPDRVRKYFKHPRIAYVA